MCFLAVSDAAWANASEKFSQAGYMIAGIHKNMLQDRWADFSLLRWKSYKQDRRTPSTLGAELYALSRSMAETRWVRSIWLEATQPTYRIQEDTKWEQLVPICAVVDNKPLFDHARSTHNHSVKDKRHAIEMLIVKEDLRAHNIHLRWVATYHMISDVLTKLGVSDWLITQVASWGKFVLIEDQSLKPQHDRVKEVKGNKENYFGDV